MTDQPVLDNMKARRSCRAYSSRMPDRALLAQVCEAGTWAPSGHGRQSPRIVVVTEPALRARLSRMNADIFRTVATHPLPPDFDPFYGAPVVLLVLADRSVPTYLHDGCAVLANMANAAQAVGLGSCWIHRAKEEFESPEGKAILDELGIQGDYAGIGHLAVGFPAKEPAAPLPRKADYIIWK